MAGLAGCVVSIVGEISAWGAVNLLKVADIVASRRNLSMERINTIVGDDSLQRVVAHSLAKYAEEETGLVLDANEPFSDASIGRAIQERTGLALRSVRDQQMVKEDIAYFAGAQIEARTGVKVTNLLDRDATLKDVGRYASGVVSQAAGVPLTDVMDRDKTREELSAWGRLAAVRHFGQSDEMMQQVFNAAGVDIDALIALAEKRLGVDPNTGKPIVRGLLKSADVRAAIYERLLRAQMVETQGVFAEASKQGRRRKKMAASGKKFREAHGHRMHYEPVGSGWLPTGWGN